MQLSANDDVHRFFTILATITPVGNRLLRKDPTGQMGAWKVREDLRKRLVKHLAKSGTDKQGI